MLNSISTFRLAILLILVTSGVNFVNAQTSTFTYQGRLTDGGTAANGTYDLQFTLWDAVNSGNQQPTGTPVTITKSGVIVSNGVFTVQLDFTATVFPGADRYLEISVKHPADSSYITLLPRQQLTSTPYAIRAASAATASGVDSSAGDSVITAINAGSSTIDANRLPATLATQNGSNTFSGANTFSTSATFSAGLSANGQRITSVGAPTVASDAATKAYVDAAAAGSGTSVQVAPPAQQTTSSTNHLVNLKLVGLNTLGVPGVNSLLSLSASGTYTDGNTYDKERFRIDNDGSILSVGDFNGGVSNSVPIEGSGTRFVWHPTKAAIRAGRIDGTQWDDANVGLYSTAFGENVRALGDNSIAVGKSSVAAGSRTIAMGEGTTATGYASVALGYGASTSTSAGSPRVGTFVFSDFSVPLVYSFGSQVDSASQFHPTVTNSFNVRAVNGSFFYTNTSLTNGLIFNSTTATLTLNNSKLRLNSDGSTDLTSNSGGSSGVTLPAGGGSWNSLSDRNMKANFAAVNAREILRGVLALPISSWNYKSQDASIRHIGPMAQDFFATFKVGDSDKTIATIDPDGVALAAIQGLHEEVKDRDTQIDGLKQQLNAFQQQIQRQQTQLESLRKLACLDHPKAEICK